MMPTRMVSGSFMVGACSGADRGRHRPARVRRSRVRPGALRDRQRPVEGRRDTCPARRCSTAPGREPASAAIDDRHVRLAERWLDHDPEADGGREAQLLIAYPGPDRRVDLLEVDVRDAVGVVADELQVVRAAVGDVPGVQAQVHGPGVRAVKETLDLRLGPDVAVGVGVEHEDGPVLLGHVAAELRHAGRQRVPLVVGQGRARPSGCRRGPCSPPGG